MHLTVVKTCLCKIIFLPWCYLFHDLRCVRGPYLDFSLFTIKLVLILGDHIGRPSPRWFVPNVALQVFQWFNHYCCNGVKTTCCWFSSSPFSTFPSIVDFSRKLAFHIMFPKYFNLNLVSNSGLICSRTLFSLAILSFYQVASHTKVQDHQYSFDPTSLRFYFFFHSVPGNTIDCVILFFVDKYMLQYLNISSDFQGLPYCLTKS